MCSRRPALVLVFVAMVAAGCGGSDGAAPEPGVDTPSTSAGDRTTASSPSELDSAAAQDLGGRAEEIASGEASSAPTTSAESSGSAPSGPATTQVVAISIDGLRPSAITAAGTPALHALFARGAGTRNARTARSQTETMPNHVCMVTGRPIAGPSGHGVTWNVDTDQTVRPGVQSVFNVVAGAGGSSAVVVGKPKLDILRDSWSAAVADFRLAEGGTAVDAVTAALRADRDLVFWHLPGPDRAGHAGGWGSGAYGSAVAAADAAVGSVVDAVTADPRLARRVAVVLTSDHGGTVGTRGHGGASDAANYTVPFVVWGPEVAAGDLYGLNPGYADPQGARTSYDGAQPVRNCDLANVVTGLLGLPTVPGSRFGAGPRLQTAGE